MQKRSNLLNGILKYTVAAIIIVVPLYPKFPFLRIPGTFVSIRLEDLLLAFSAVLLIIAYFPNFGELFKVRLFKAILLFLAVGFISFLTASFLTKTVVPHISFLHWARRIEYFIPLLLGIEVIKRDRKNLEFYFKLILVVIFFVFVYGFGQRYFDWPIIITQNEEYSKGVALRWLPGSHINSTFAGHYDLATFLVLILPIIITAIFVLYGTISRIIVSAMAFSGLWLLVNTASRISIFSYVLAVSTSLIIARKHKMIPLVIIISISFVAFSSNLLDRYGRIFEFVKIRSTQFNLLNYQANNYVYAADEESLIRRKTTLPTPSPVPAFEDRSTNIRLNVEWPRAIRALSKNPLLGTGYSSITLATDNDYLRLFGEVGILGFLSFLLIFLELIILFLKALPIIPKLTKIELVFFAGVVGSLPGIFTNAFFIDIFEASKFATLFWLLVGFAVILTKNEKSAQIN